MSHWHLPASLPRVTRLMSHCVRAAAAMSLVAALLAPLVCPQMVSAGEPFTIETIAGATSDNGFSGDGGPALDAEFYDPMGIARDSSGNVFIADFRNHRVRMIPARDGTFYGQSMTGGCVYTIAGTGTQGYTRDGFMGPTADLKYPNDVAVDGAGNVYLSDSGNHCIRMINATGIITTVAGYGSPVYSGDNVPATSARLNWPRGIWLDASANLYIADEADHLIRMVPSTSGTYFGQAMTAGYIYSIAGKPVDSGYSGDDGTPTSAELNFPYSVYLDAHGHLYIGDANNHVVRMIPATTDTHYGIAMTAGYIYTIAGTGGSAGYDGDGGDATSAKMYSPHHMLVDVDGALFVADNGNDCIRKVTMDGTISTYAGTGTAGFSGDGGPATEAQLYEPDGMFFDALGNLVFADSMNDRIRVVFGELEPWLTYQGSEENDHTTGIAVDTDGYIYVTGETESAWHTEDGEPVRGYSGYNDAFVAKLDYDGDIIWYTFLGGAAADGGTGIAVDADRVYITGLSENLAWSQPGDSSPVYRSHAGTVDAFVAVLDSNDGNMEWYTFLGGELVDFGCAIDVDNQGSIFVAGTSEASWVDASTPARAYSGGKDVFAAGLDSDGSLLWHTFLGGTGEDCDEDLCGIAVSGGNVYVTATSASDWSENPVRPYSSGHDAFVAKLDADDGTLSRHTFLGGGDTMFGDVGRSLTLDTDGDVYITGSSENSWGNPVREHPGGPAVLVARLTSSLELTWHTFLGNGFAEGRGIAPAVNGGTYVVGCSERSWGSPDDAWSSQFDAFAAKLSGGGTLTWNTFSGGDGAEFGDAVATDTDGGCVVAGYANKGTWAPSRSPVRPYSAANDGFVVQYLGPASVSFDLDLQAGWNMVSVPLVLDEPAVEAVFWDSVVVYTWDAAEGVYIQVHEGGDLTDIEPGRAYWVKVTDENDGTLTVTGVPVDSPTTYEVDLSAGWNMVGSVFHSTSLLPMSFFVAGDPDSDPLQRDAIYYWAASEKEFVPVGASDPLEPGVGYWLASATDCTVTMVPPPV